MKTTKILTVAAALIVALSLAAPASASCGTPAAITVFANPADVGQNGTSWVFSPPIQEFGIYYYFGAPYVYSSDAGNPAPPPVGPDARVSFWRVGAGDPAVGFGIDNGVFDMVASGDFYFYGYSSISIPLATKSDETKTCTTPSSKFCNALYLCVFVKPP